MGSVNLTQGVKANLLQLQRNAVLREEVSERLATGRRVNRVADDPRDFYAARALGNRVGDLFELKSGINQALSTVEAGSTGLSAIEDLTRQLRGIAQAARGGSAEERQAAADQFNEIRSQITQVARDTRYGGRALIDDPADDLETGVGDPSGATLTTEGQAASAAALGIGDADADYNGFAGDADIDAALADVSSATDQVRAADRRFGSDAATLTARRDFNENLSGTLQASADNLAGTDLSEDAARQVALQVQDRFAQAGLRFAVRTDSLVVDLLGTGGTR